MRAIIPRNNVGDREEMLPWLIKNVGPLAPEDPSRFGIAGEGWHLDAETYEDTYAMIQLLSGRMVIAIDDEAMMTAFLLRWG